MKRLAYSSWDEFFMQIADSAAKRSKDPRTQNGASIRDPITNKLISIGYNGLPRGLDDDGEYNGANYWKRELKHQIVLHAEQNAILNTKEDLTNKVLYLSSEKGYYPCTICSSMLGQVGIKELVLKTAMKGNTKRYNFDLSKHILEKHGIKIRILNETVQSNKKSS